jgi:outer membrane protein insertion porin family
MKKLLLVLLLGLAVLLSANFLLAETNPPANETAAAPSPDETTKQVNLIDIKGNKTISTAVILAKIKSRVGQDYLQNVISDDIKRLYNTGYFSDVSIDREDYKDGFKLIFILTEKPIIEKITFSKTRFIRERKLRLTIKSKEGDFFDEKIIKDDLASVGELYKKEGFSLASVDYKSEVDSLTNKAKVRIIVEEGKRTRIARIFVKGNRAFKYRRIIALIKTRSRSIFNGGFYKKEILEEDMERIISFYNNEGYLDVKSAYTVDTAPKGRLYVNIAIEEGKQYFVGKVSASGNTVFTEQEVFTSLKAIKPNNIFSEQRLDGDVNNIRTLYFDKGYIFAEVAKITSLEPATGKVDVGFTINEGVVAYVDKIKIKGNAKTKDLVIRRELRIHPGDRFDGEKLRRSKERLRNLGFFEDINYDTEPAAKGEADKRDLVVEVKESKTGQFSFGGGYSTVDQLVGFAEIEQKNFDWKNWPTFTGAGQDLKLHFEMGSVRQNLYLSFTEPWVFDYPVSFGFDGFMTEHKREDSVGYGYDEKNTGGDLRLGKEFSDFLRGNIIYSLADIKISNVDDSASNELKKEIGTNTISKLGTGLTYDTRDNINDPTRGYVISGFIEGAGGPLAGDKNFGRFTLRGSYDIPLELLGSVLEFRGQSGWVSPYGDSEEVPIYERFFAGGAYTIRGYNERKVGPVDPASNDPIGGDAMVVGNIELIVPIMEFIRGAVFFDTGNVWAKVGDWGKGGFKSGFGFGARIKTPIGPIKLDYGFPLNSEPGEESKSGKFYFSMSHGF